MKIEQALVLYLLKHKQISLQGIGTFKIDGILPETTDNDKPVAIPPDAISFVYDPKVKEDDHLIDFIVLNTKKIRPLASADLDSFLTLGRQFINIGKPFTIQNLGTIEKLKSGDLDFKPGPLIQRVEAPKTKIADEGAEQHEENLFNDYQRETPNNNRAILMIFIIILLGAGAWAVWHFAFKNESTEQTSSSDNIVPVTDSLSNVQKNDSLIAAQRLIDSLKNDSATLAQKNTIDSAGFKVVVSEAADKNIALARLAKLQRYGRKVMMYTDDSVTYKIVNQFNLPLADTTKVLDSLNKYYYRGRAHLDK